MYNFRSTLFNLKPLVTTITVDPAQSSPLDKVTDALDVAKNFAELEHAGLHKGSAAALHVIFPLRNRKSGFLGTTHRRASRPLIDAKIYKPTRQLQSMNVNWGARRIRKEPLELGIDVSQAAVSNYVQRSSKTSSQRWWAFRYYHTYRNHLSLNKDFPETQATEPPESENIVEFPYVGGCRHRYLRRAA